MKQIYINWASALVAVLAVAILVLNITQNLPFGEIHDAKEAVANLTRDPDSVKFRNVILDRVVGVCGEFNAKNDFGVYVGYQRFYYLEGEVSSGQVNDEWNLCDPIPSAK